MRGLIARRTLLSGCAGLCLSRGARAAMPEIETVPFGATRDGQPVDLITLRHPGGLSARVTPLGAALVSLTAPDRHGLMKDIVLGLDSARDYEANDASMGATVGRYANRIAGGRFALDGQTFQLPTDESGNTLHGGPRGFAKAIWASEAVADRQAIRFRHVSPAGDQGFPGRLETTVVYRLLEDRLVIEYEARTDAPTVINLTNHSYFNLSGDLASQVLDHRLTVDADDYTVPGPGLIPTGEVRPVEGSPLDFRAGKPVGQDIASSDPLIVLGAGFDHNLIIRGSPGIHRRAARLEHPASGRFLEVWSTEPALQVYTANWLDNLSGKGRDYRPRTAICLEPQHYPDSPNRPAFPSTRLNPGDRFTSLTEFRLGVIG
ncbi:aldose epimerase family protein [Brevundimonas subvibrioides]|uniref:aldose epimerase family protein n=1 Tax=Brevundimonas subvibrioides TaxID=74313 RepID=UPI0022B5BDC5|nr:aldose epimerase family protein [Brevundimonas subvibrioides]